jgi:hypothetical protein
MNATKEWKIGILPVSARRLPACTATTRWKRVRQDSLEGYLPTAK